MASAHESGCGKADNGNDNENYKVTGSDYYNDYSKQNKSHLKTCFFCLTVL